MNTRPMHKDGDIAHLDPVNGPAKTAKDRITDAAEAVKDTAASVASDVKDRAAGLVETAKDSAMHKADEARSAAVDAGHRLSDTLREAAERQPEDSFAAKAMTLVAGGLSDLTRKMDSTSVSQAMAEARDIARRHPVATATVAAAVGFALMRLVRAMPVARGTTAQPSDRPEF